MAEIHFQQIVKRFGNVTAVNNFNLDIGHGEFIALLGPSGCGKTTVLRMLAGFEKPTSGYLRINGTVINDVPPQDRHIGIVFQDYAVFPTMTVFDNVAYGLRLRQVTGDELTRRVGEILSLVGLAGFERRMPAQLSGGQLQRVALARALVIRPQVLLLDEPLSNLDAALRLSIRREIRNIQRELGITTIFVTHDQEEALSISDRVAVMRTAQLMQVGSPMEIYNQPRSAFVAGFIGRTTLLQAKVASYDREEVLLDLGPMQLRAEAGPAVSKGDEVWVSVRPQHVRLKLPAAGSEDSSPVQTLSLGGTGVLPRTTFDGVVEYLEPLGSQVRGEVRTPSGIPFLFEISDPQSNPVPTPGAKVECVIYSKDVVYGPMTEVDRQQFANGTRVITATVTG